MEMLNLNRISMSRNFARLLGLTLVFVGSVGAAFAAPPAECRGRFVGTWKYAQGETDIHPDGSATARVAGKTYPQHWTCVGNKYMFGNQGSGGSWTMTLTPDGSTMTASFGNATRQGGSARGKTATKEKRGPNALDSGASQDSQKKEAAKVAKAKALWDANGHVKAGNASRRHFTYADKMMATHNYREAAKAFARAGDMRKAKLYTREAEKASLEADEADRAKDKRRTSKKAIPQHVDANAKKAQKEKEACQSAVEHMKKIAAQGTNVTKMKMMLRVKCPGYR